MLYEWENKKNNSTGSKKQNSDFRTVRIISFTNPQYLTFIRIDDYYLNCGIRHC